MMTKEKFALRENIVLASILLVVLTILVTDNSKVYVAAAYIMLVIAYINIKYIRLDNIGLGRIVRRFLYLVPLYLPLIVLQNFFIDYKVFYLIIVGIFVSTILHIINYRSWRLQFSKEVITENAKRDNLNLITVIVYNILTAIGEEIFFRGFLIGAFQNEHMLFTIPASTLCFVACHMCPQNIIRSWNDILIEVIFSIIAGVMLVYGKSIWPCISAHFLFNLPYVIVDVKTLIYKRRERDK